MPQRFPQPQVFCETLNLPTIVTYRHVIRAYLLYETSDVQLYHVQFCASTQATCADATGHSCRTFKAGFLILHWHWGLGNPLLWGHHCGMGSSILARSTWPPNPQPSHQKGLQTLPNAPWRQNLRWVPLHLRGNLKLAHCLVLRIQSYVNFTKNNLLVVCLGTQSKKKVLPYPIWT